MEESKYFQCNQTLYNSKVWWIVVFCNTHNLALSWGLALCKPHYINIFGHDCPDTPDFHSSFSELGDETKQRVYKCTISDCRSLNVLVEMFTIFWILNVRVTFCINLHSSSHTSTLGCVGVLCIQSITTFQVRWQEEHRKRDFSILLFTLKLPKKRSNFMISSRIHLHKSRSLMV